ncbi:MAG TPA: methyltransferase domain-containing protein [Pirellulales bacterium]
MAPWAGLSERALQPEVMDQPGLDPQLHDRALRALARINILSRSADILYPPIRDVARRLAGGTLSILDLASGGGDVTIALWQRLRRAGITARIVGRDKSSTAVDIARRRAARLGAAVEFEIGDVLERTPGEAFDVVVSSLFMHHLDRSDAMRLLDHMQHTARHLALVSDLQRSRLGYALAVAVTQLVSRSPVVHVDGPRSVEGAFSVDEARRLAADAGMQGATVRGCWPCRFLLSWTRRAPACGEGSTCSSATS